MHYSTKYYSLFQKYGLDKLLRSHGNFNLLAPVNDALKKTSSRKVMSCHLLSQAVCHFVIFFLFYYYGVIEVLVDQYGKPS